MRHLVLAVAVVATAITASAASAVYRPPGGVPTGSPPYPGTTDVASELEPVANAWLQQNGFTTYYFSGTTCRDAGAGVYPHHAYDCTAIHTVIAPRTGVPTPYDKVWESFRVTITARLSGIRFKTVVSPGLNPCAGGGGCYVPPKDPYAAVDGSGGNTVAATSTGMKTPLQPNGVWGFNLVVWPKPYASSSS